VLDALGTHRVRVSSHALREAEADGLLLRQIEVATEGGECIEDCPTDPRGPSCLILGRWRDVPIHALWGFDEPSRQAILITVYLPDAQRWSDDFRKRRPRNADDPE
jgi:hypothetical protein